MVIVENTKNVIFGKYANYLIKYARYKNGPSKNRFYGKKWSRNNKETVGTYIYRILMEIDLSIYPFLVYPAI